VSAELAQNLVTVKEYEELPYARLRDAEVSRLEMIVEDLAKSRGKPRVFRFLRKHAKAQSFVGIIKAGECTVQILPKIYDDDHHDLGFLVHLLAYTKKLELKRTGTAGHEEFAGSLLEI
jgi:hypothetical protein